MTHTLTATRLSPNPVGVSTARITVYSDDPFTLRLLARDLSRHDYSNVIVDNRWTYSEGGERAIAS